MGRVHGKTALDGQEVCTAIPPITKKRARSDDERQSFESSVSKRPAMACPTSKEMRAVLKRPASLRGVLETSELTVRRALPHEWRYFRDHHYKDHRLSLT